MLIILGDDFGKGGSILFFMLITMDLGWQVIKLISLNGQIPQNLVLSMTKFLREIAKKYINRNYFDL
jgi:hypothetical protein